MKARYIRVSSSSQNNARQLAKQHPDERLFIDVVSGSLPFSERPQGQQLIKAIEAKEIDYLSVSSVDRLGRNTFDIQTTLNWLTEQNVNVYIDNLGMNSLNSKGKPAPTFKLILDILANISQMERESIMERQAEGIAIAVAQGRYKGREKGTVMSDEELLTKHKDVVRHLKAGKSLHDVSAITGKSKSTIQRIRRLLNKE